MPIIAARPDVVPRTRRVSGHGCYLAAVRMERHHQVPPADVVGATTSVYGRAFAEPPYFEGAEHEAALVERLQRYAERPGFRLTLCRSGEGEDAPVVGMALSVHARAGDWWRDRVAAALGPKAASAWLEHCIREVVHVAVDPGGRRQGVGRLLTEDALDDAEVANVVLSCHPDAAPAQALYRSCGFQTLSDDFRTGPEQPGFLLMARPPAPRRR